MIKEAESEEYGAFDFTIDHRLIKFRVGKITPTKTGQFVTLWKRIGSGPIAPYDVEDPFDLFVISVRDGEHFGQFVFPKILLYEKGILSKGGKGGKRALRIYPPWDKVCSRQAQSTQDWQCAHFFTIPLDRTVDILHVRKLFLNGE